jgi:hypothetical protein
MTGGRDALQTIPVIDRGLTDRWIARALLSTELTAESPGP